jgi:uncharacterized protein (TIGR02145 family)
MKKILYLTAAIVALSFAFIACNKDVAVTGVTLSQTNASITVGDTLVLTATVQPASATNKTVTWSSNDVNVVVFNGKIITTGLWNITGAYSFIVTVTTQDGNKTATCTITVNPAPIPVTSVSLTPAITLVVGDTQLWIPVIHPHNATNKNVTWSSNNPTVATIATNGRLTTVSAGSATITVTTQDGNKTDTCAVTVVMANMCNVNTPNWGTSLGTVSFASDTTWTISGNGITQIWSDAVQASNCNKTSFNGWDVTATGTVSYNCNADCRSNPNQKGDLFSWCAVARFGDQLCPDGWRVPTKQDFIDLDIALDGTGNNECISKLDKYLKKWGGTFNYVEASGTTNWGWYWSQSEGEFELDAFSMGFSIYGDILPSDNGSKGDGRALRCVR